MLQHLRSVLRRAFNSRWLFCCWAMLLLAGVYYCVWHLTPPKPAVTIQLDDQSRIIFSPDGSKAAEIRDRQSSGRHGIMFRNDGFYTPVSVWDLSAGAKLFELPGEEYRDDAVDFSPNGQVLLLRSKSGAFQLFDASSGKLIRTMPTSIFRQFAKTVLFSPDSKRIAFEHESGENDAQSHFVYNINLNTIEGNFFGDFESARFSLDGVRIATREFTAGNGKISVLLWGGLETGQIKLLQKHNVIADEVTFSPDLKTFVTIRKVKDDLTKEVTHLDFVNGQTLSSFRYDGYADGRIKLEFAPGGTLLMDQEKRHGGRYLYVSKPGEAVTESELDPSPGPQGWNSAKWSFTNEGEEYRFQLRSSDRKSLADSFIASAMPVRLKLKQWHLGGQKRYGYPIFSADDRYVAIVGHWDRTKKLPFENWIPDRWRLLMVDEDSSLSIYDLQIQQEVLSISDYGHWYFTPDSSFIRTLDSKNRLKSWRLPSDKPWLSVIVATVACWLTFLSISWLAGKCWHRQFGVRKVSAATPSGNS